MDITLRDDCIVFKNYPFYSIALEQNENILHAKDIFEISIDDLASVVRIKDELILISYSGNVGNQYLKEDAVEKFAERNRITVINRYPIITDILACFTEQGEHNIPMLIEKYKVKKKEIFSVRLLFYLFKGDMHILQDLCLWDFLDAVLPLRWIPLVGKRIYKKVYMFSMRVALKAYI